MTTNNPSSGDPGPAATGADTLVDVLKRAADNGFDTQLIARVGGQVECEACEARSPAAAIDSIRHHRLEGASDAADMMVLIEARCPNCDAAGVLTLGYGPNATAEDVSVLEDLTLDDG